MPIGLLFAFVQADAVRLPSFFIPVLLGLLIAGALGWLVAAVFGFSRATAFGAPTRWFAIASVCMLLYHLQWVVFVIFGYNRQDEAEVLMFGSFFNLFVVPASVCAIIGFMRLSNPRP